MTKLTVSIVAIAFVLLPHAARPAAAQGPFVSAQQLFEAGTKWTTYLKDGVCLWRGQEPSGSIVWGWEAQAQCTGVVGIYGYDHNADGMIDVATFPVKDAHCGSYISAWQYFVNGAWSEYVRGICVYSPSSGMYQLSYNYFSTPQQATCASSLSALTARKYQAHNTFLALQPTINTNYLGVKIAWHNKNQAELTWLACKTQLASGTRNS
jgi:hypothetical protein